MFRFLVVGIAVAWLGPTASAQAPIPDTLVKAKRAYMVNEAGDIGRFDALANELRKWGRFELVSDPERADVVFVFGKGVKGHVATASNGNMMMAPIVRVSLEIRDRKDNALLWSDEAPPVRGAQKLVSHLRERFEGEEKKRP